MNSTKEQLFRTVVDIPASDIQIDYGQHTLMIGSCFTENMGAHMQLRKFPIIINPTGIVYNPLSALKVLELLLEKTTYTTADLIHSNGLWSSYDHHGSFSAPTAEECLERIESSLYTARAALKDTKVIFLTFGTSWVYRLKSTGRIVSNCHKQPEQLFERSLLTVDEIVEKYKKLLQTLHTDYPDLHIVFTVSPIRHWRDGAHGNQISKAILHLAIDEITKAIPNVSYFPSYEIVMDELRDYRFYADDMLHVTDTATTYIWQRFQEIYMTTETCALAEEIHQIQKLLLHRPLNPGTTQHIQSQEKLSEKITLLTKQHPFLDFTQDLAARRHEQ